jgi:hypothetical protein
LLVKQISQVLVLTADNVINSTDLAADFYVN